MARLTVAGAGALRAARRLYCGRAVEETEALLAYARERVREPAPAELERRRKGGGGWDAERVRHLARRLRELPPAHPSADVARARLLRELLLLPNRTHPAASALGERPHPLRLLNPAPAPAPAPADGPEPTAWRPGGVRRQRLGEVSGPRAYYLCGPPAQLEEALLRYTVSALAARGYRLVSVPDVLPATVLSACGAAPHGLHTQVYRLDPAHHGPELCLSGTAEMSLAGLLQGRTFAEEELPHKMAAVSRCYRAEASNSLEQRGLYRVHQFTKVEMFAATRPERSDAMLEELRRTQEELFAPLGLHMRVLDMPPEELGAAAYRKYDIEAWMPGRSAFGEVSSCSNCTDYQSRRLGIWCAAEAGGRGALAHTLNGTACAVPRMLIALVETHRGRWPAALRPFLPPAPARRVPDLKLLKSKHS